MQIVIDIPKETYDLICKCAERSTLVNQFIADVILQGKPLPDGHGKLIDANEVLKKAFIRKDDEGDVFVTKYYCIDTDDFDAINAIIEADI